MIRKAFTMRLKPGALAEYKRNHDNIWPELVAQIEREGIASMTIFERDPVLQGVHRVTPRPEGSAAAPSTLGRSQPIPVTASSGAKCRAGPGWGEKKGV